MFSDDPQMTLIMRHLKEFSGATDTAAISVTNPLGKVIEFHWQICLSALNQMRILFLVTGCLSQLCPSILLPPL